MIGGHNARLSENEQNQSNDSVSSRNIVAGRNSVVTLATLARGGHFLEALGRSRDNEGNQDLLRQACTFRRGPNWRGAHEG